MENIYSILPPAFSATINAPLDAQGHTVLTWVPNSRRVQLKIPSFVPVFAQLRLATTPGTQPRTVPIKHTVSSICTFIRTSISLKACTALYTTRLGRNHTAPTMVNDVCSTSVVGMQVILGVLYALCDSQEPDTISCA